MTSYRFACMLFFFFICESSLFFFLFRNETDDNPCLSWSSCQQNQPQSTLRCRSGVVGGALQVLYWTAAVWCG